MSETHAVTPITDANILKFNVSDYMTNFAQIYCLMLYFSCHLYANKCDTNFNGGFTFRISHFTVFFFLQGSRCYSTEARQMVTMIPGDGIGPEISQSVKDIFSAAGVIDGLCTTFLY